jgi:hypothetical protein
MKSLKTITFNTNQALAELSKFKTLLNSANGLSEQSDLLPLFKTNQHLCALMGQLYNSVVVPDLIAYEYDLFGDFTCDFVIGDSRTKAFCFIEFEDAKPDSIFKTTNRATSEWSNRFEHGFSQFVDWIYKLHDTEKTNAFADRFGAHSIEFMGALIIGRSQYLTPAEQQRLKWRQKYVLINSQRIRCLTFDDLLEELELKLTLTIHKANLSPGKQFKPRRKSL